MAPKIITPPVYRSGVRRMSKSKAIISAHEVTSGRCE